MPRALGVHLPGLLLKELAGVHSRPAFSLCKCRWRAIYTFHTFMIVSHNKKYILHHSPKKCAYVCVCAHLYIYIYIYTYVHRHIM